MDHLTFDEIVDFVSMTEYNQKAIDLASVVNGHICKCDECLKVVRSMQLIYDEFSALAQKQSFRSYISESIVSDIRRCSENLMDDKEELFI